MDLNITKFTVNDISITESTISKSFIGPMVGVIIDKTTFIL